MVVPDIVGTGLEVFRDPAHLLHPPPGDGAEVGGEEPPPVGNLPVEATPGLPLHSLPLESNTALGLQQPGHQLSRPDRHQGQAGQAPAVQVTED